ncbi:MAG: ABC transporter substrate-binding protein [Burkholderiales bacterium PBB5]|nr:MAG: ABC transporter substrate-binding protein [Burkholderiales bacterium PBB5]
MSLRRHFLKCLLASLPLCASAAQAAGEGYRFSPVNQYGINVTAAYWNPIIAYVSEKSGVPLQLKIGRTSADTTSYVLAQEVEFIFSNHMFSPEREQLGWKVFGRRFTPPVRGQIIVPTDSTVTEQFPYAQLLNSKVTVKPVFAGNMDAALVQLFNKKVAAAGVNSQLAEGYGRREGKSYRTLWSSGPLHDLALMAASKVPEKDVKAVAKAFIGMHTDPRGRDILEKASQQVGLTAEAYFIPSDGSEYTAYRDFYRTAPPALR